MEGQISRVTMGTEYMIEKALDVLLLLSIILGVVLPISLYVGRNAIKDRLFKGPKIFVKRMLSYFKSDWCFNDYPISIDKISGSDPSVYTGNILNWWSMTSRGETKEMAAQNLKAKFNEYLGQKEKLPRPGDRVPLKYASTEQISKYRATFIEYYDKVLSEYSGFPWFVSDLTNLSSWEPINNSEKKQRKEEIIRRTQNEYGIDIRDYYDEPIYKILAIIAEKPKLN
jgi:hypothetical protein